MPLFLHIGFPKTATTSLQLAFQAHSDDLHRAGICYPLIDDDFKQRYLKLFDQKGLENNTSALKQRDDSMAKMVAKIAESGCDDVILSCEELTNFMMMDFAPDNLRTLRDALRAIDPDIRIVAYVRNPSDFYLSILQEKLKRHGGTLDPHSFKANFDRVISLYEEVFETTAIVREFHATRLKDRDIVADFLEATGLTRLDISDWEPVTSNESLSPEVLMALDLARKELTPDGDRLTYSFRESELLWRRMRRLAADLDIARKPVLFTSAYDTVMATNADGIAQMQDRYGISFAQGKHVPGTPLYDTSDGISGQISGLEAIMEVDRTTATHLSAAMMAQLVREMVRLRDRNQTLRADLQAATKTPPPQDPATPADDQRE